MTITHRSHPGIGRRPRLRPISRRGGHRVPGLAVPAVGVGGALAFVVANGFQASVAPTLTLGAALMLWMLASFASERPDR
jgi:hypothetical protein